MITWVEPSAAAFGAVAELFDEYRAHYGEQRAYGATRQWLQDQATSGGLRISAAFTTGRPCGLVTVSVLPASLTLGTFWLVRDLYVRPEHRGRGHARALVEHVVSAARDATARRVSLQTEHANTPARTLYRSLGFHEVDGYVTYSIT
ncbi:GNAT family N-acetyltransferase [Catellatospora bangladeshensis]|uniref:N-acetyltransferase n=1 Tax=Catellatospora bangladeshensis TaxID=310355 RepID=A0A8J3J9I1_9ACTN|nr:GNAT family N-acetyltransferase [Catellatospora bangladeshensis]GIF80091.1 N-acetyltransferase [Catellatospora bangladeshensis]